MPVGRLQADHLGYGVSLSLACWCVDDKVCFYELVIK